MDCFLTKYILACWALLRIKPTNVWLQAYSLIT
uniref:Uncharacterized protein n=1 Tax=Anguilla anguilla TaxID=7936 RepID=A0A0E9VLK3_ANGAN